MVKGMGTMGESPLVDGLFSVADQIYVEDVDGEYVNPPKC
jgi:hypothetical protein